MHEFSVTAQIVETILKEIDIHNVKKVNEVYIDVGELTFLAHEQLIFAYQILTENTPLKDSKMIINEKKSKIRCENCGYVGGLSYVDHALHHLQLPIFTCPKCNGKIEILEGKECTIMRIICEK